jgi:ATP-dependent DNA helicase RecQ
MLIASYLLMILLKPKDSRWTFDKEMEQIYSGTKLNINIGLTRCWMMINKRFMIIYGVTTDQIEAALKEFEGDYDTEELRLMRIKFMLEVAN